MIGGSVRCCLLQSCKLGRIDVSINTKSIVDFVTSGSIPSPSLVRQTIPYFPLVFTGPAQASVAFLFREGLHGGHHHYIHDIHKARDSCFKEAQFVAMRTCMHVVFLARRTRSTGRGGQQRDWTEVGRESSQIRVTSHGIRLRPAQRRATSPEHRFSHVRIICTVQREILRNLAHFLNMIGRMLVIPNKIFPN